MAASFPGSVSANQVGSYFVGQYYHVLQQQPDFAHQFYTDASTMIRIDGNASETATEMLQIHSLIMSLNFTGIEIKTAHSLDSWNGGVLVVVSGSVQAKDFNDRRRFVQTFFLAPQEKGYFVLNDMFHFLEDEQVQHPGTTVAHSDFESKLIASNPLPETVSDYTLEEEIQSREFVAATNVEENDVVDKYSISEPPQPFPEADNAVGETPAEESSASYSAVTNSTQEPPPVQVEEPVEERPKQTYASILRDVKGQMGPSVPHHASLNKTAPPAASDWQQAPQPTLSHLASSMGPERSNVETTEEIATLEEEGVDGRSVYVRNLPSTISASDLEQEFNNFGRIKPDGIVVRNKKDNISICYAFVEFEDAIGVENAIKASPIQFGGRQVHIEERKANSSSSRGGRRGRGRGSYQSEAPRGGRFGSRPFGRGRGQDGADKDYNYRPRGNGFQQRVPRQEKGILGNHVLRNGPNLSEA